VFAPAATRFFAGVRPAGDRHGRDVAEVEGAIDASAFMVAGKTGSYMCPPGRFVHDGTPHKSAGLQPKCT
jgi:hypothetical protein